MPSPIVKKKAPPKLMTFTEALVAVLAGEKVTRIYWRSNNEYMLLHNGFLSIHHEQHPDNVYDRLLVGIGDMTGTDWVLLKDSQYERN